MAFVHLKTDLHKQTLDLLSYKFHLDKILHTIVYFLICIYYIAGGYFGFYLFNVNQFQKFLIAILLLAFLTEGVQLFVPYRAFSFFDMLANILGIGIGLVVIYLQKAKINRQKV